MPANKIKSELKKQLFDQGLKNCANKSCKQQNPQSLISFNNRKSASDGLRSVCRSCDKEYKDKPETKLLTSIHNKSDKTKEYNKKRGKTPARIANKAKNNRTVEARKYQKEYSNRPEVKQNKKIVDKTLERKQYFLDYGRKPSTKLSSKIRKQEDRKNNPEKYAAEASRRRAMKLVRTPKWLTEDHYKQIEELHLLCFELQWLSDQKLTIDHIIPLKGKNVSGLHVPWNLQILGYNDNSQKSRKFDGTYDNNGWSKK